MGTFQELKTQLETAEQKKTVLTYLINHLDATFRSVAGKPPEKVLMTDDKRTVPDTAFEAIIGGLLIAEADKLATEIVTINETQIAGMTREVVSTQTANQP